MSINDIYTESTYQFVATNLDYMNDATGSKSSGANNSQTLTPISEPARERKISATNAPPTHDNKDKDYIIAVQKARLLIKQEEESQ